MAKTAGERMSQSYLTASPDESVRAVRARYLKAIPELKNNDYIYVTNGAGALIGVFSVKEAFAAKESEKVSKIMKRDVVRVRVGTRQERVAILAMQHDFDAIPVVDKEDKLVGVVPSGAILDILYEEHVDDFLKIAGIHRHHTYPLLEAEKVGPVKAAELRIPWLVIGLLGGIVAAAIIELFEGALTEVFVLAAFIPLVVYIAGAIAAQTTTLFIRMAVMNAKLKAGAYLAREATTGAILGAGLGLVLFAYAALVLGMPKVGLAMWASLLFTAVAASIVGFAIPFVLERLGHDPAVGAGPIGTIISDVSSLLIYLIVSIQILALLG